MVFAVQISWSICPLRRMCLHRLRSRSTWLLFLKARTYDCPCFCNKEGSLTSGIQVIIKWRGKPVFIRHRTQDEIKEAEDTKWESLRDPQPDSDRVKKPEWLIMVGMARHTPVIT